MTRHIALIGPGRVGQAVARLWHDAGHDIVAVIGRDPARTKAAARFIGRVEAATIDPAAVAAADLVALAVPDDAIGPIAAHLRRCGQLAPGTVLVHFSGLHPAAILLGDDGPPCGALAIHPLQTFADAVAGVRNLPGTPCAIEGEPALMPLAEALVADLGGRPFAIDREHKALYHAAACVASNYLVTLADAACELLGGCGISRTEALPLLTPLLRGTLDNLATLGPQNALTGPIARGDTRTVARHLAALEPFSPELNALYRTLGRQTVAVARGKGALGREREIELRTLLAP